MIDEATTTTVGGAYTHQVELTEESPSATVQYALVLGGPRVFQQSYRARPRQRSVASLLEANLQGVKIRTSHAVLKGEAFIFPGFGEAEWSDEDELELIEPSDAIEARRARYADAIALLDDWLADDSGYDEATWPVLKAEIERSRTSTRRRFSD